MLRNIYYKMDDDRLHIHGKVRYGKRGFVYRLVVITPLRRSGMARVLSGS